MGIDLIVNGEPVKIAADEDMLLLFVLREELGLTGTKYGCDEGQCGACTVLVDGEALCSCVTAAAEVAGKSVLTIEGLQRDGELHPLQQSFLDCGAFQCGYCTPGFIMAALALLNKEPQPGRERIIAGLGGNICRCGGYRRIIEAVQQAAPAVAKADWEAIR